MSKRTTPEQLAKAREYSRFYRANNADKCKESKRPCRERNLDKNREYSRLYNKLHPEQHRAINKAYRERHPDKCREKSNLYYESHKTPEEKARRAERRRKWTKANPEKVRMTQAAWQVKNREKRRLQQKISIQRRKEEDPAYSVNARIRSVLKGRIYKAVKLGQKSAHTMELLGCSMEQFKAHIESLWQPGMSWENYGFYGWHLDHRTPVKAFDLSDPEQQKKCFRRTNFQPLWSEDNFSKGAKVIHQATAPSSQHEMGLQDHVPSTTTL